MAIREWLRTIILGNSLYFPDRDTIFHILKYELVHNLHFIIFAIVLLIFNILVISFIWKSHLRTNLGLGFGLLLILSGLVLQKIRVVEYLNTDNVNRELSTHYISELLGLGERKQSLRVDVKLANLLTENKTLNFTIPKNNKSLFKSNEHPIQPTKHRFKRLNTNFLSKFKLVLEQKYLNELNFMTYYKNLKDREKIIDKLIMDFSSEFDVFINMSKNITTELFALNSSPKYFKFEFNDLKTEIQKYFSINENDSNFKKRIFLRDYINNILNLKHMNQDTQFVGGHMKIIKTVLKMRILFLIVSIICLIFLCSACFEYFLIYRPLYIILCLILSLLSFISILLLIYAQILDKDCKSGRIDGCKIYLQDGSKYSKNLKQYELLKKSEEFRQTLEDFLIDTNQNLKKYQSYLHGLFNENVSYRVLVFKNLFDKLLFVRDDFNDITKNKINSGKYFDHIRNMYKILDNILNKLNGKLKEEMLEIFIKEIGYGFYINTNKDMIVESAIKAVSRRKQEEDKTLTKKCGDVLDKLCMSKEYLEDIFNLIIVLSVAIFVCII